MSIKRRREKMIDAERQWWAAVAATTDTSARLAVTAVTAG